MSHTTIERIQQAIAARSSLFDQNHKSAIRLFNGFTEGAIDWVIEVFARTVVIYDHHKEHIRADCEAVTKAITEALPWVQVVLCKIRSSSDTAERNGIVLFGDPKLIDHRIVEHGVHYQLELNLHQDASFYLDTRNLRRWALDHLHGKSVLNTFAYTGSLGVAARASGARTVVHVDRNKAFLSVAKGSYTLNGFPIQKSDFCAQDFFVYVAQCKRQNTLFDCVFIDPPFQSKTDYGSVDLQANLVQLINKVRPLVAHNGMLVTVNNALFLSGKDYYSALESICSDGFLTIDQTIDVPLDCVGLLPQQNGFPTDPAPFNHPTKMAVLSVKRKDGKTSINSTT